MPDLRSTLAAIGMVAPERPKLIDLSWHDRRWDAGLDLRVWIEADRLYAIALETLLISVAARCAESERWLVEARTFHDWLPRVYGGVFAEDGTPPNMYWCARCNRGWKMGADNVPPPREKCPGRSGGATT